MHGKDTYYDAGSNSLSTCTESLEGFKNLYPTDRLIPVPLLMDYMKVIRRVKDIGIYGN